VLSYRDTTFCSFHDTCKDGEGCTRALTDEVKAGADKIGLPICQWAEKPKCYKEAEHECKFVKELDCDYVYMINGVEILIPKSWDYDFSKEDGPLGLNFVTAGHYT